MCIGWVIYVHIPKDERHKLDAKIKKCIFIGYREDKHGYQFYNTNLKNPIRFSDVVFQENKFMRLREWIIMDLDKIWNGVLQQ